LFQLLGDKDTSRLTFTNQVEFVERKKVFNFSRAHRAALSKP